MSGVFQIYQDRAGKYRWRLKVSSGYVCATGEAYATTQDAWKACERVERAAVGAEIVEVGG